MFVIAALLFIVYFVSGILCGEIFCKRGVKSNLITAFLLMLPVFNTIYVIVRFRDIKDDWNMERIKKCFKNL